MTVQRRFGRFGRCRRGLSVLAVLLAYDGAAALRAIDDLPYPPRLPVGQVSVVTYADGVPLATIGDEHRIVVPLSRVPVPVRRAVLAAENRGFYRDPGVSPFALVRAAVSNARGNATQGGSTITQQYAKNAYVGSERTLGRKLREAAVAVKLDRDLPKDEVLELYLNTIWFGRGAYGIEAAAWTYFGVGADRLTVAQAAVLAGGISSPTAYDPALAPEQAHRRWAFVLDGMVASGWLPERDRVLMRYPPVLPRGTGLFAANAGPAGLVLRRVRAELLAAGFDPARLDREPLRVVTTLDGPAQRAATREVAGLATTRRGGVRAAVVAIDPRDGELLAYAGGLDGVGVDYATAWRQAGSTLKPFAVAAAREAGIPLTATFNGRSPRSFYGMPRPVRNDGDAQCPRCTLVEATTRSINTAFYSLAREIGPDRIASVGHRLGIPATGPGRRRTLQEPDGTVLSQIVLGRYEVRPYDLAVAYATLAAGGVRRTPYLVREVRSADGRLLYRHRPTAGRRVLDPAVAADVTRAMAGVPAYTGHPLPGAAAKTGTVQGRGADNKDAWMAGYTARRAAAVWVGTDTDRPIRTAAGTPIAGAGPPATIWERVMRAAPATGRGGERGSDQKRLAAFTTVW